jgi:hypothetical protein
MTFETVCAITRGYIGTDRIILVQRGLHLSKGVCASTINVSCHCTIVNALTMLRCEDQSVGSRLAFEKICEDVGFRSIFSSRLFQNFSS